MDRPRRYRVLRIAVTVVSLTACLLLVALWVRSYYIRDHLHVPVWGNRSIAFTSREGRLAFVTWLAPSTAQWSFHQQAVEILPTIPERGAVLGFELLRPTKDSNLAV